jgi:hypothetical protein
LSFGIELLIDAFLIHGPAGFSYFRPFMPNIFGLGASFVVLMACSSTTTPTPTPASTADGGGGTVDPKCTAVEDLASCTDACQCDTAGSYAKATPAQCAITSGSPSAVCTHACTFGADCIDVSNALFCTNGVCSRAR